MSEIEDLLSLIKECWPKFVISKENLERPTQEFVIRFYETFLHDYNEKVEYLKDVPTIFHINIAECTPEEQLFLQLSKLLRKIEGMNFTLADIYQPIRIRTKNFFTVLIHFLTFIDYLPNETYALDNGVFAAKDETAKLLLEQQKLIDETNEAAKYKVELIDDINLLKQEIKSPFYKEMKSLKNTKEKSYTEKRILIENLKQDLQNVEYELQRVESEETDLLKEKITDKEYKNILHSIQILKSESEILDNDDIDIGDGLEYENKVLQHSRDCNIILNKSDFNIANVKTIIYEEDALRVISNAVDSLISTKLNPLKQQITEKCQELTVNEGQLTTLSNNYKIAKDALSNKLIYYSQEIDKLRNSLKNKSENNEKIILDYEVNIKKLQEDLDRYRKTFTTEYIKVSKVEQVVVDEFKEILIKFKEMMEVKSESVL